MRIGLVGYNTRTGLGELNRQIVWHTVVHRWLVKPHKSKETLPLEQTKTTSTVGTTWGHVTDFVDDVDVVVFCETPYYDDLVEYASLKGRRVVCVPMQEWMPARRDGWVGGVDLFICPTADCYLQFKDELPCESFPWPRDVERFPFRQRTTCERFLFVNGNGGWQGRKGMAVIQEALRLWPEMPLIVHDQKPAGKELADNADLYREGDVLLCPHSIDGLCLEIPEAMLSGLPVIATDGPPWNEHQLLARINSTVHRRMTSRMVNWYTPSAKHLVEICQRLLGRDVSEASRTAHERASQRSWSRYGRDFTALVRGREAFVDNGGR